MQPRTTTGLDRTTEKNYRECYLAQSPLTVGIHPPSRVGALVSRLHSGQPVKASQRRGTASSSVFTPTSQLRQAGGFEIKLKTKIETTILWWAGAVCMVALIIATVTGNAAVLSALAKLRRAPAHYPLASLAVADLLIGLFVLPLAAARELFVFHLNSTVCACWSALDVLCCTASILSLCTLGWERHCGITAPLARARRAKHARRYAALVWPVAALVAVPTVVVPSPKHYLPGEEPRACSVNTNVVYVLFSTFSSFYLPAVVMVVLYAKILWSLAALPKLRTHRGRSPCVEGQKNIIAQEASKPRGDGFKQKIQKVLLSPNLNVPGTSGKGTSTPIKNSSSPDYIQLRQRRATRTIVMLMFLFLFCWTPFFIMLPLDSVCDCVWDAIWQWSSWLGYANSMLNPIVYAAASPSVRRAMRSSLTSTISTKTNDLPLSPRQRQVIR